MLYFGSGKRYEAKEDKKMMSANVVVQVQNSAFGIHAHFLSSKLVGVGDYKLLNAAWYQVSAPSPVAHTRTRKILSEEDGGIEQPTFYTQYDQQGVAVVGCCIFCVLLSPLLLLIVHVVTLCCYVAAVTARYCHAAVIPALCCHVAGLAANDLTSDLLHALKGLSQLNMFRADGARVSHATFNKLSTSCTSLIEIGLSKCIGLKDVNIIRLVKGCPDLRVLNLSCCDAVTVTAIAAIVASCLKHHSLMLESCSSMTEVNLQLLGSRCVLLEVLDLTDCCGINDTGAALGFLPRCIRLKFVKLGPCNNISDTGLSYLASKCKDITELDLYRCAGVGDEGMVTLSRGCKNLKKLNVSYCDSLTDKGMAYIGTLKELCDLEMRALVCVTGTGLQAVASGCKRLAQLDLKYCSNIQDSRFWALANYSKNLWQVNLCECSISDVTLLMVMTNLICLQDAKLVHLSRVTSAGFELGLGACGTRT